MQKLSKAEIEKLKTIHGELFKIQIEDKFCILKKPDRKTLSYASSVGSNDPIKFNEIILNGCWITGDEEIRKDDMLFLSASSKVAELIEIKEASLEKL